MILQSATTKKPDVRQDIYQRKQLIFKSLSCDLSLVRFFALAARWSTWHADSRDGDRAHADGWRGVTTLRPAKAWSGCSSASVMGSRTRIWWNRCAWNGSTDRGHQSQLSINPGTPPSVSWRAIGKYLIVVEHADPRLVSVALCREPFRSTACLRNLTKKSAPACEDGMQVFCIKAARWPPLISTYPKGWLTD